MRRFLLFLLLAQPALALDFNDRQSLVADALGSHPILARLRAEAAAAGERIAPAGALPNPMLMAGVQNRRIDLKRDEMTMYMVGASQTMTSPSRREARRNVAALEARTVELELDSAAAELERDVLLAWYDVAAADAQIRVTTQVRELVDALIAAARVRYEIGTSAQADVIRAQLELSDLDHEILSLRGTRRAAVARLLPLLGLPPGTEVPPLTIPETTDDLPAKAAGPHPAIAALEADVERQEEVVRLARMELRPDIDLEAQYGVRPAERDMFSVVARVELPFRRGQTVDPRIREAMALRDAARTRIDELRRALESEMGVAAAEHAVATEQMAFHHEVLVPQARLAFDSTLAAYQTGKAPFDAILTTETDYLRLHLQYYDFLARHAQAVVRYEALRRGTKP